MHINSKMMISLRNQNELTQTEMAKKLTDKLKIIDSKASISKWTYVQLETGKRDWRFTEVWEVCKIFKLTKKQILKLINL